MGNKSSSHDGDPWRPSSTTPTQPSSASAGWKVDQTQSSYSQYAQNYPVQQPYPPSNYVPPTDHDTPTHAPPPAVEYDTPSYAPPNYDIPSTANYGTSSAVFPPNYDNPPVAYPPNYNTPSPSFPPNYDSPYQAPPQFSETQPQAHIPPKMMDRRYSRIADNYNSLEEVTQALRRAGLESSNLIVGIDFTKSNEWTGKRSFNGQSLHYIGSGMNPYEHAISIIGKTLVAFDDDNLIPCFGFGDASTHDRDVFSFYPEGRFCNGFEEVVHRYREIVPHLKLAGPTSFAPIIEMAMTIVEQSGGQYHVLLIIADGQVTRSVDTEHGRLSPQEQKTVQAIVEASKLPLSIVLVGVGDGPWDTMKEFDDNIPAREFDNFQFVNFSEVMSKNANQSRKEAEFALKALMEIPYQYKATIEFNLLGKRRGNIPERFPLPPPVSTSAPSFNTISQQYQGAPGFRQSSDTFYEQKISAPSAPFAPPNSTYDQMICSICNYNPKNMVFGCGHQTCSDCGRDIQLCPICRSRIENRIKLQ